MADLDFRLATEADGEAWDRFVARFANADFSHSFRMKSIYESVYNYRTAYWIGEQRSEIRGICPLVYVHSLMHANRTFLISLPMVTSAGLLVADADANNAFLEQLESLSDSANAVVQLRGRAENALADAATYKGYVTFVLSLSEVLGGNYWSALSSRNRGKIRKSRNSGTQVVFGGTGLLDDFYALYVRRNTELATPVYPQTFFAAILEAFPEAEIALARNAGAAIAGMLNVGYSGTMHYVFGSSDSRFFGSYPNNHLFYEFIERAIKASYRRIDFGRTPLGAGTYAFKKQWMADEVQLFYQYLGRDAEKMVDFSIQGVRESLLFRVFSHVWSRYLPRRAIEVLGPALIKRMPLA